MHLPCRLALEAQSACLVRGTHSQLSCPSANLFALFNEIVVAGRVAEEADRPRVMPGLSLSLQCISSVICLCLLVRESCSAHLVEPPSSSLPIQD